MQCELLGVTKREQVLELAERLTGLSGRPGKKVSYRNLLIKSQATPFTELHLVQHTLDDQAVTNDSWEVYHEGLLVRGKGFADLPAVVRSRTTAAYQGRHSLSLWKHLGFSVSYELVKKGFSYLVYYDDFELEVLLCSVGPNTPNQQAEEHITATCQQYWLLKITTIAPEAQQARAAHAIGAFSKHLEPLVELRKSST
ncbi:hypothetical protein WJX77_011686 [Trebouxia sp. C0004]